MPVIALDDPGDPRLDEFRRLADPAWLAARGLFVAEGRLVVERLLTEPALQPTSILVTDAARAALELTLRAGGDQLPIYVVPLAWMKTVTGFNIHRGCLATGLRPPRRSVASLIADGCRRMLVLEGIGNPDNVGGLFRNARALDVDGVVLGPGTGDPLYRKAIRVSSGASLSVPFAAADDWPHTLGELQDAGLTVVALTPAIDAMPLDMFARARPSGAPLAILVGAESAGLTPDATAAADERVRIPIDAQANSLNVAVAAGIALHVLG
jgi:tRNA G18 (ribose-2'-O)-methylase SpoU